MLKKKISNRNATDTNTSDPNVRPIEPLLRQPTTDIERLAVAALKQGSTTSLGSLVNRVARELYKEEVARGAGALDIGLFGPKLFINDVVFELRAGNGTLWDIESSE